VTAGTAAPAAWVNGEPLGEISVLDRGLHYADGLFETIACPHGAPRLLARHLARLTGGCARLHLPAPDPEQLSAEICAAAAGPSAIVKLIVSRGRALARGYAATGAESPTRIMLRYPWAGEDPSLGEAGVRVRIADLRLGENPALAGLKTLNRLEQVLARAEWHDPSIAESLLFSSSGTLVSGTMSNVFLVHQGRLSTPRLERCGVAGVMRALVSELAAACGIDCTERALTELELQAAQEVFLTNAVIGLRPVRELAGVTLAVGPVTRRLQQALAGRLHGTEGEHA
jgi:4-amino-4-deoxychorismate lyase